MAKYRNVTEKAYETGWRVARLAAQGRNYADWRSVYERGGYGEAFNAAAVHLADRSSVEWRNASWTPAQLRYFTWKQRQYGG